MKKIIFIFLAFSVLVACKEPIWNAPPAGGSTPAKVSTYRVTNINGKSIIHFEVPDDNTLYVMAEYTLANGKPMTVKGSRFADSLLLEGFSKAQSYSVQLYAVGESEQKSEAITVTVAPETPNYLLARQSLSAIQTFGGLTVEAVNPGRDELVIEAMRKTATGEFEPVDRYYSGLRDIRYHIRGQEDSLQNYAFFVRDRWMNYSDTVEFSILPLREIHVPPSEIEQILAAQMPGSAAPWSSSNSYRAKNAVDGIIATTVNQNYYMTARGTGMPQHFNVELSKTYRLSRAVFYERPTYFYRSISPRKMAIWGATDPNIDGSFDGWTLLGEFEVIKPSGQEITTDEDNAASIAGHDFDFDGATIPVRYLRIQTLETWGLSDYVAFTEISFYGNTVD